MSTPPRKDSNITYPAQDTPLYNSDLGTPVMGNLEIAAGNYPEIDENGNIITVQYGRYVFNAVSFEVVKNKVIKETYIDGANDVVYEYIADGTYRVTIKITLTGTNGAYPNSDMNGLMRILNSRAAITVFSNYLANYFDIYQLIVFDFKAPRPTGKYSQQLLEITCRANKPVNLVQT